MRKGSVQTAGSYADTCSCCRLQCSLELLGLCGNTGPGVAQSSSKGFLLLQTVRTDSGHIQRPAQCEPATLSRRIKNGWSYISAPPGAFFMCTRFMSLTPYHDCNSEKYGFVVCDAVQFIRWVQMFRGTICLPKYTTSHYRKQQC